MTDDLSINTRITLSDGRLLPVVGFGVSGLNEGEHTQKSVHWALDAGYRQFDTAKFYQNEASVGKAINDYDIERDEVWVTTKLWPTDFSHPKKTAHESLERLDLGYIDLFLVHWPTPIAVPGFDKKLWRAFEYLVDEGVCRSIGVSNYQIPRLEKLLSIANVPPSINQVKCSPFEYPVDIHKFCSNNNIALIGYEPLDKARRLDHPLLNNLASTHKKSPAQIMLRWAVQKGISPIPKSQSKNRIYENIDIFDLELTQKEMKDLDSLS